MSFLNLNLIHNHPYLQQAAAPAHQQQIDHLANSITSCCSSSSSSGGSAACNNSHTNSNITTTFSPDARPDTDIIEGGGELQIDPTANKGKDNDAQKVKSRWTRSFFTTLDRRHNEERYVCDICHKDLASPSTLKLHKNTHVIERRYKCEPCQVSFHSQGKFVSVSLSLLPLCPLPKQLALDHFFLLLGGSFLHAPLGATSSRLLARQTLSSADFPPPMAQPMWQQEILQPKWSINFH